MTLAMTMAATTAYRTTCGCTTPRATAAGFPAGFHIIAGDGVLFRVFIIFDGRGSTVRKKDETHAGSRL